MPDNKEKYAKLQEVIEKRKGERGAVMPCLQEAMNIFGYVPQDVQEMIADGLGVTLSEVYGVSTFYSQFSLKPKGEHVIGVCLGGRARDRCVPGHCLLRQGKPEDYRQNL